MAFQLSTLWPDFCIRILDSSTGPTSLTTKQSHRGAKRFCNLQALPPSVVEVDRSAVGSQSTAGAFLEIQGLKTGVVGKYENGLRGNRGASKCLDTLFRKYRGNLPLLSALQKSSYQDLRVLCKDRSLLQVLPSKKHE